MANDLPKRQSFSANVDVDVAASTVHARGGLNLLTGDILRETIEMLVRGSCHHITLNLDEVTKIDVGGVNLLATLRHTLRAESGELTIINARPTVWGALHRAHVAADPLPSEDY